jgi:hypothetical protein
MVKITKALSASSKALDDKLFFNFGVAESAATIRLSMIAGVREYRVDWKDIGSVAAETSSRARPHLLE